MRKQKVQDIIQEVFPKIQKHYGFSKFQECSPYIELDNSIYETSASEKNGTNDECNAQYCSMMNEITIYYPQMKSRKMVIQTLIHEYIHYLQSPTWFKRYYNMGYNYSDHPYEIKANEYEKDYKLFI